MPLRPWMSRASFVFAFTLSNFGCAHSNSGACQLWPPAPKASGYVVEWQSGEDLARYDAICRDRLSELLMFEVGLVRGNGQKHLGAKLRRTLEASAFGDVALDGWSMTYACGTSASFVVTLNAKKNNCKVDRALSLLGEAIAQQDADDRVLVRIGVWEAPAL